MATTSSEVGEAGWRRFPHHSRMILIAWDRCRYEFGVIPSAARDLTCCLKGPPEFTNEVQHQLKVLQWANTMVTSRSKSGARLPSFTKPANRSARSRQLWIARHRACLAS